MGDRKAEEEPIAELWAPTTTPRGARPVDAQQAEKIYETCLGPASFTTSPARRRTALRRACATGPLHATITA